MTGLESKASQPQASALGRYCTSSVSGLEANTVFGGRAQLANWALRPGICKPFSALSPIQKLKRLESPSHSEAQASAPVPRTITKIVGTGQAAGRNVRPRAPSALGICTGRQQQPDAMGGLITLNLRNILALVEQLPCTFPAKPFNPACTCSLHSEAPKRHSQSPTAPPQPSAPAEWLAGVLHTRALRGSLTEPKLALNALNFSSPHLFLPQCWIRRLAPPPRD